MPKTHSWWVELVVYRTRQLTTSPVKNWRLQTLLFTVAKTCQFFSKSNPSTSFSSQFALCFYPKVSKKTYTFTSRLVPSDSQSKKLQVSYLPMFSFEGRDLQGCQRFLSQQNFFRLACPIRLVPFRPLEFCNGRFPNSFKMIESLYFCYRLNPFRAPSSLSPHPSEIEPGGTP